MALFSRLYVCSFLLIGLTIPAFANTYETTSHVTAATVFSDRALVTRTATAHISAGANIVSVTDLPAGINEATLRVKGKAAGTVKIGSVEVKHIFLTEAVNAAQRDKAAAIQAKTDELALVQGDIKALNLREQFIQRIVDQGADKTDNDTSKIDFAPEKWAQAWTLVQNGMGETEKQLAQKQINVRKLNEDIARLQAEMQQIHTEQAKERREAHIDFDASQDTELELSLTYQTTGASWYSVYDARLDTGSNALDLEQYGQVFQQTGEDWTNIDLTLSTAQPATGAEMPRLAEWILRLFQPVQPVPMAVAARLQEARSAMANQLVREKVAAMNGSAMPTPLGGDMAADATSGTFVQTLKKLEMDNAAVQTTDYAAEFHIPGAPTVKSVNEPSKLFIATVHLKAELAAQTSPRLSPLAYLFAKVTNSESYPLIPGLVAKYRDGTFIGNGSLALLRAGETANLSFGVDDRVKVTYQRVHEEQNNPTFLIGDMNVERHYQTKVQNLHKDPMTVTIFEQYPIAADPDVTSTLLEDVTTPGYIKDPENRQGIIAWTGPIAPKEEKTFVIGYRVKYPKDRQIMGM